MATSNIFGPVDYSLSTSRSPIPSSSNAKRIIAGDPSLGPQLPGFAEVKIKSAQGNTNSSDLRAKLKVPASYIKQTTSGRNNELGSFGGILFPYTPQITYDVKADYSTQQPLHSNFQQHFYQKSSVGSISLTAKFTVQNERDAGYYLSCLHLLKALTRMRTGRDTFAGSPPPVCRLSAYGPYQFENVPVAVNNFRVELPDSVDFFTLGKNNPDPIFGTTAVPTISSFVIGLLPMYSRKEMIQFSINGYLTDTETKRKGFL